MSHTDVAECVLSKDSSNLIGYRRLDFDKHVQYDEVISSEESGVEAWKAKNVSSSSNATSKPQAKGSAGKSATRLGP